MKRKIPSKARYFTRTMTERHQENYEAKPVNLLELISKAGKWYLIL
jgi:hypothetical protein